MGELIRYPDRHLSRQEREVRAAELAADRRAEAERKVMKRAITTEVKVAAHKVDGVVALAAHIMQEAVGLDNYRQILAKDDPLIELLLSGIEAQALHDVKKIQARLYSEF